VLRRGRTADEADHRPTRVPRAAAGAGAAAAGVGTAAAAAAAAQVRRHVGTCRASNIKPDNDTPSRLGRCAASPRRRNPNLLEGRDDAGERPPKARADKLDASDVSESDEDILGATTHSSRAPPPPVGFRGGGAGSLGRLRKGLPESFIRETMRACREAPSLEQRRFHRN
jgi:hypothetical protein